MWRDHQVSKHQGYIGVEKEEKLTPDPSTPRETVEGFNRYNRRDFVRLYKSLLNFP